MSLLRKTLDQSRKVVSLLLALLLVGLAGRFTFLALQPGNAELAQELGPRKPRQGTKSGINQKSQGSSKPTPTPARPAERPARKTVSGSRKGDVFLDLMLSVKIGPPRSQVFVDGEMVGNTPFAGDVSCKAGDSIQVEVVPPKGEVIKRSYGCRGTMIQVLE